MINLLKNLNKKQNQSKNASKATQETQGKQPQSLAKSAEARRALSVGLRGGSVGSVGSGGSSKAVQKKTLNLMAFARSPSSANPQTTKVEKTNGKEVKTFLKPRVVINDDIEDTVDSHVEEEDEADTNDEEQVVEVKEEEPHKTRAFEEPIQKKLKTSNGDAVKVIRNRVNEKDKYDKWSELHQIISIDPPTSNTNGKLRYKINFRFIDPNNGRTKRKTVRFAKKNESYYIDNGDEGLRKKFLSRLKGYYTPLHKNYWVVNLLCNEKTISESYHKLLSSMCEF